MKRNQFKITLYVLTVGLLAGQIYYVEAQTNHITIDTNMLIQSYIDKESAQAPDAQISNKDEMLKHCAEIMASAIDPSHINDIDNATSFQTNTEVITAILNFDRCAAKVARTLNEAKLALTKNNLRIINNDGKYSAVTKNLFKENLFFYHFEEVNTEQVHVSKLQERTQDGRSVIASIDFYENGKIKLFETLVTDSEWLAGTNHESLSFKQDGEFNAYSLTAKNFDEEKSLQYNDVTNLVVKYRTWNIQ